MIMVAHSPNILRRYCSAAAILRNGKLEYFEDIEDAIRAYNDMIRVRQQAGAQP
jgi:capsular polysaccharide transport system ATP-binding protein